MVIGFLSDYGLQDEFVGVCHGVIARRCASARVIDITHAIPRHDVRAGALALAAALPFLPRGVALAVVDPGVGGPRRALALATAGSERWLLVGPDNGLLMPAAERLGGVGEAFDIGDSRERLKDVSRTFHGRDVFAPVAAALADGAELATMGSPVEPHTLASIELGLARVRDGVLEAHVLRVDAFGNLSLDASASKVAELGDPGMSADGADGAGGAVIVRAGAGAHRACRVGSFGEVREGELLLYEDSLGTLALAVNRGSAAALLRVREGDELRIERA